MSLCRIIPRFSLRTLVVFLLLVTSGVGLWWLGGRLWALRSLVGQVEGSRAAGQRGNCPCLLVGRPSAHPRSVQSV